MIEVKASRVTVVHLARRVPAGSRLFRHRGKYSFARHGHGAAIVRAPHSVDRGILGAGVARGAKPSDLPTEEPSRA
jgi:hypothetical protein